MSRFKIFMNKYMVTIVMVPSLIGIHWGWYELHRNEALVPKHQQKDEQPIVSAVKTFWRIFTEKRNAPAASAEPKEVAAAK